METINMSNIISYASTVLVTIVISMTGFWLVIGREYTTRSETNELIDIKLKTIEVSLQESKNQSNKLERVIEENTKAIQGLQIQLATLNRTLEIIEKKNDNNK